MSSKTTNFNLHKIDLNDAPPDITVLNQNWDRIDTELKNLNDGKLSSSPSVRTTIPDGTDLAVYFADSTKPWGSYYGQRDYNLTNAPLDIRDYWFFDRTPSGIYARCASDLTRLWWASSMNNVFGGWIEIDAKAEIVTGSGAVTVTLADNTEYEYTNVTSLNMTGADVECHGFVTFSSPGPAVTLSNFAAMDGDDVTQAMEEVWEFSVHNNRIIWKNWGVA